MLTGFDYQCWNSKVGYMFSKGHWIARTRSICCWQVLTITAQHLSDHFLYCWWLTTQRLRQHVCVPGKANTKYLLQRDTQLSGPGTLVWHNTEFNGVKDQPFCISYFYAQYFAESFQTDKLPISQETVQPWFGPEAIEAAKWKFTNSFFKYFHP